MLLSYPSIYALGHKAVEGIFDGVVVIQEKLDGSQFSFGVINGQLLIRSKGAEIFPESADKMWAPAVATVVGLYQANLLHPDWIYRAEAICKPKHNTLCYSRVPRGGLILYDVTIGLEDYASPESVEIIGEGLNLEVAPTVFRDKLDATNSLNLFRQLLETESILGGTKIEGIVIKNYAKFTRDKHVMMAKVVSDMFKEKHKTEWAGGKSSGKDIVDTIIESLRTPARWQKAVQHLREQGTLLGAPQDIGPLMREVQEDVFKEEEDEIKDALFKYAKDHIRRGVASGLAKWYKQELAKNVLAKENSDVVM